MPSSKRLISQFNPDNYHLELDLDKKNKRFSGKLIINGYKKHKPSYRFTFNQLGLKVTSARIVFNDKKIKKEIEVTRIVHHKKLQELRLHTKEQVKSGKYAIELEYSGKVSTKGTNGFYTSSWLDKKSNQKEILTTQFEPHYARQLLPCIDEPEAKAFFNLQLNLINSSTNEVTLFNTPIKSSSHNNGLRTVRFNTTPKMSTYLLALIVGELKSKENKVDNTLVRVFTTPDKVSSVDFALEFASKSLKFLEEKFGMSYPLEKLDLVAVPDFDAGGMENWGLLTFREDLLLFDKDSSTLADKQMIALIIAHEVAHQWFGNLVTMKWWDELWLKEGFANFIEYYTVDNLYPEWNILEQYLITEKNYAIRMDSLLSSRPIVNKVKAPHHAVDAFDSIAYEKSGSVIRMLFSILREENFLKGLKDYFEKYKFSSATSKDLLLCWQRYTSVDLIKFTEKWLVEPGLPKVDLSVGKNSKQIVLRQSQFLSEDEKKDSLKKIQNDALKLKPNIKKKHKEYYLNNLSNDFNKPNQKLWYIPISFVYSDLNKSQDDFVMQNYIHTIQFPKYRKLPIKLNKRGESFYITSYPIEFLAPITKSAEKGKLNEFEMLNILSDIIALNKAQQFKPGTGAILSTISAIKGSTLNTHFWSLSGGFIASLHHHLKQIGRTSLLNTYIDKLISKQIEDVKFRSSENDSPNTISVRFELLSLASLSQNKKISDQLYQLFLDSKGCIEEIESEKRLLVLYIVAKNGKKKDYNTLLSSYINNMNNPTIRDDLTYGLCVFEGEHFVKRNLMTMLDGTLVKDQDILSWLSQLLSSDLASIKYVLNWILNDNGWNWLETNLSPFDKSSAVKIIISTAFNNKDLAKLKKFFVALNNNQIEKALNESLDIARSRISWHKKELPNALKYLEDNSINS